MAAEEDGIRDTVSTGDRLGVSRVMSGGDAAQQTTVMLGIQARPLVGLVVRSAVQPSELLGPIIVTPLPSTVSCPSAETAHQACRKERA
jgi:hypothetical protein